MRRAFEAWHAQAPPTQRQMPLHFICARKEYDARKRDREGQEREKTKERERKKDKEGQEKVMPMAELRRVRGQK